MLLVDTSVWIEVFRKPNRLDLADFGGLDEVVTCLPIIQEVLQGFREEGAFRIAQEGMWALPCVDAPLGAERFEEAVRLYRLARRGGITPRSAIDCLIAVCAIRHDLTVLHRDRDFAALATISPLRQIDVKKR